MGGGSPTIDGGMTQAEYRQLQQEEREWQEALEDKKYQRAVQYEMEQREYEQSREEQLEAQKRAEELALEQGEMAIQGEILAQDEDEDEESNMGGEFMEALATNNSMRPE